MAKKILIIAGESSGDKHAANLVAALKTSLPNAEFFGMAGPQMRAAGVEALIKSEDMAIMGFLEILFHLRTIKKALKTIQQTICEQQPDLVILVDYPGFNLRVAKFAKEHGCKVLYYISPKVWAWKQGRIKLLQKYVDHLAVIFPFEADFYKPYHLPVTYVGNPLAESVQCSEAREAAKIKLALEPNRRTIALVPGSRKMEIKYILPTLVATARFLVKRHPDWQFVLPVANTISKEEVENLVRQHLGNFIHVVTNSTYLAIRAADAAVCKSGTVTLETALLGTPQVVVYRMSLINYLIVQLFIRRLVKVDKIGLCNLVVNKFVAKELIQNEANPQSIGNEVERLILDNDYRAQQELELKNIQQLLLGRHAARETADLALELMR